MPNMKRKYSLPMPTTMETRASKLQRKRHESKRGVAMCILPTNIFALIVSAFLTIEDISALDRAGTNLCFRPYLLDAFAQVITEASFVLRGLRLTKWVIDRRIRSNCLQVWIGMKHHARQIMDCCGASLTLAGDGIGRLETLPTDRSQSLKSLGLMYCSDLSNDGLIGLTDRFPQLQYLSINNCSNLTVDCISRLSKGCPNITTLSLAWCNGVDNKWLSAIASSFKKLKSINLSYCRLVSDVGVWMLARSLPSLEEVNLAYCTEVTDIGVIAVCVSCPGLKRLSVSGLRITDKAMVVLSKAPVAQHVEELVMTQCKCISSQGVSLVLKSCPRLGSVNVEGCGLFCTDGMGLKGGGIRENHLLATAL